MNDLTWGQFKKDVESHGVTDTTIIHYIDFSYEWCHIEVSKSQIDGKEELVIW